MSENQDLLLESDGEVVTVTLNRPDARNALTFDMYSGLAEICADPPEGAKAIIVRGAGDKAFAAGTDIRQFICGREHQLAHALPILPIEILNVIGKRMGVHRYFGMSKRTEKLLAFNADSPITKRCTLCRTGHNSYVLRMAIFFHGINLNL